MAKLLVELAFGDMGPLLVPDGKPVPSHRWGVFTDNISWPSPERRMTACPPARLSPSASCAHSLCLAGLGVPKRADKDNTWGTTQHLLCQVLLQGLNHPLTHKVSAVPTDSSPWSEGQQYLFFFFFESSNGKKSYQIWKQGQKAMDKWSRASKEMTGDLIMGLKVWREGGKNLTGTCVSLYFFENMKSSFLFLPQPFRDQYIFS